ncbi:MAG: hypothetical protein HC845_11070 [Akkermansiaceae bacterium]|nr:hypothetical protein [Akkermansiaceae bacterium]
MLTGTIVFDLGEVYSIERLAIWQGQQVVRSLNRQVNGITLETSLDSAFTVSQAAGNFNVPLSASATHPVTHSVNDFDLTDTTARYVRLTITSNHGSTASTSLGEIAFAVNQVPEPTSALLGLIGSLALLRRRR